MMHAKMLRLELLQVKTEFERDLVQLVLDCSECGQLIHWVAGLGASQDTGRTGSQRHTASRSSSSSRLADAPEVTSYVPT
jgi:hypothetical protein